MKPKLKTYRTVINLHLVRKRLCEDLKERYSISNIDLCCVHSKTRGRNYVWQE